MKITGMQVFLAVLAVAGMAATWTFNALFIVESGGTFSLTAFISGAFANNASSSIAADILVVVLAFLGWMLAEARRLRMKHAWIYAVLTFSVALAFAFPLFLLMRERAIAARAEAQAAVRDGL